MALGGVAAGNLGAYLPLLLQHVHAQAKTPKQLYQLLKVTTPACLRRAVVCLHILGCGCEQAAGARASSQHARLACDACLRFPPIHRCPAPPHTHHHHTSFRL